jgi:hypothetical protein
MPLKIHNYTWRGERLVKIESQPHHIDGLLDVIQRTRNPVIEWEGIHECEEDGTITSYDVNQNLDRNPNLDWADIYSAYFECEVDGTTTVFEGESAKAGNPGIWTYIVYECPEGKEEVVSNPSIDVLAALLKVQRGIQEMKKSRANLLPHAENAVVDIRKLRNYCLNPEHDDGKHKARLFLSRLGMTADHAEELQRILLEVVKTGEVRLGRRDTFGQRYTLDFSIEWQNRSAILRSGWIIEHDSTTPRLTTCYPL